MGKNKLSGAREAPLYPKSSGQAATNENQVPTPFNWENNADKTEVLITMKDGYRFDHLSPNSLSVVNEFTVAGYNALTTEDLDLVKRVHLKATTDDGLVQGSANEETIDFDDEYYNDDEYFSHASGVVTVIEGGLYSVFASILYYNTTDSARNTPLAYVKVNGIQVESTISACYDRGSSYGKYSSNHIHTVLRLEADDTVEIAHYAYNEDGTLYFDASGSEFIVVQVSGTKGDTGNPPAHEWNGPYIRFENPDGSWGDWQNLQVDGEGEQISLPIGYVYFQLPGKDDPSTMNLAGTWENISTQYAGDFFRVEGGDALAFNGGQQGDTIRNLTGYFTTRSTDGTSTILNAGGVLSYVRSGVGSGDKFGRNTNDNSYERVYLDASDSVPTDVENRSVNQTIRIWERIS